MLPSSLRHRHFMFRFGKFGLLFSLFKFESHDHKITQQPAFQDFSDERLCKLNILCEPSEAYLQISAILCCLILALLFHLSVNSFEFAVFILSMLALLFLPFFYSRSKGLWANWHVCLLGFFAANGFCLQKGSLEWGLRNFLPVFSGLSPNRLLQWSI